jgi:hypothetical protein
MSILSTVEGDINIAETWIKSLASKVEALISGGKAVPSEVATIVTDTEAFLAAATPAVAGEGLNFPADSVAYASFVKLVGDWQKLGATIAADVKTNA